MPWIKTACLVLLVLMTACGGPYTRSTTAEVEESENWWCVRAQGVENDSFLGCATTETACERNRAKAMKWGRLARIKELGPCTILEVAP